MSPHTFPTSPGATGDQRKFTNPTLGFVGANVFGPDGKPTAIAVEPGGEVWLTPEEERMTAEAPRLAQDNPFVKLWEEIVDYDGNGEPSRTIQREGTLVLSDEAPRPVASDRFIPAREGTLDDLRATREAMEGLASPAPEPSMQKAANSEPEPEPPEVVGSPDIPEQPPVEGQPSPDEIVGTPEAKAANDEALAEREPTDEQPTVEAAAEQSGAIPV